jgi:AraC-like DNA-binding protein
MDVLSEALNSVRVTAAIFVDAEFTAPWGFVSPPAQQIAPVLAPGTERLVIYHLVSEGEATVRLNGSGEMRLTAGDIVIVPHGDSHDIFNGAPSQLLEVDALERYQAGDVQTPRFGGNGPLTRLVCGFFGCERHAGRLFLAGLPPLVKVNIRSDPAGGWLENSILHLAREAAARRPGGAALLSKMAEALFIATLRRYADQLPPEQTGWLAGMRDPIVGRALALLHSRPCEPWTVTDLAGEVGASRAVVAKRFAHYVGEPPLTYLARWRLQLAARWLQTTRNTVLQVASDIGYESEAAFNRAFKREFGIPPAQYRRKAAENAAPQSTTEAFTPASSR